MHDNLRPDSYENGNNNKMKCNPCNAIQRGRLHQRNLNIDYFTINILIFIVK